MSTYKGDASKGEIEIIRETPVYENAFCTLYDDHVAFANGEGRYVRFEWKAPYGVVVLPRTVSGDVLLIRTFRHETRSWNWEVPKGFGEQGLTPEQCALKELREETGYTGTFVRELRQLRRNNYIDHIVEVLIEPDMASATDKEVGESISECRLYPKDQIKALLASEKIHDPLTLFALSYSMLTDE